MLGINKAWLIPAAVGIGLGYMLSPMISKFLPVKPFHAYAAHSMPMRHPVARPVHHAVHPVAHPAAPVHYVPVRRSFDRSYDSWLHTTVNSLPAIG